jgi:SAM-dependent methyltransferase
MKAEQITCVGSFRGWMTLQAGQPIDWNKDRQSFDGVADLYDTYRPEYPVELIECIVSETGLRPADRILEIGSGTGKATLVFARRGYSILCIEPGKNLVFVAAKRLKHYANVAFEVTTFEAWSERLNEFNLVISAQAFHWISKEIGYAKAARVLQPNGWLALFWNMVPDPSGAIFQELEKVYREYAPEMTSSDTPCEEVIQQRGQEILESGQFEEAVVRRFPWSARYDTRQYLGLLNTYSDHLRLPEGSRQNLFHGIAQVIDQHGGTIDKPYLAVLYLARKV